MPQAIRIRIGRVELTGELFDTPAGKAMAEALPLECHWSRWGDEYYGTTRPSFGSYAGATTDLMEVDGLDNRSKISPQEVLSRIGPGGLSISTIGLGNPAHSKRAVSGLDEAALVALAEKAGGGYGYANDEISLRNLYERYGRALQSEYVITYTSPAQLRDAVNRRLTASLELEPGQVVGAAASPVAYNPGGLVPEVAQPANWVVFFILIAGLLVLLFIPIIIGKLFSGRRKPEAKSKNVRLGPKIKLRS